MGKRNLYLRIGVTILFTIVVILLCVFLLPRLIRFFFPFVVGWIISMIANPLVRFMEKKIKIVRKHGSAIIIIGVLAGVSAILYGVSSFMVREVIQLAKDLPDLYDALNGKFDLFVSKIGKVSSVFPVESNFDDIMKSLEEALSNFVTNYKMPSVSDAGYLAKNIADGAFSTIIAMISAYFFIADRDKIVLAWRRAMPDFLLEKFDMIVNNFKRAIGGYFRAQFKLMIIVFAILWLGFALLRVDYSFLLALGVAFIDLLPFFGTGAVLGPWAVYSFIIGRYGDAVFLVVIYLLCQVIKQVLQPKMVGDSIGVSPLTTLFFMFVGYRLGGLLGLIIGIPIGMVLVNFYHSGLFDNLIRGIKIIMHDLVEFMKF